MEEGVAAMAVPARGSGVSPRGAAVGGPGLGSPHPRLASSFSALGTGPLAKALSLWTPLPHLRKEGFSHSATSGTDVLKAQHPPRPLPSPTPGPVTPPTSPCLTRLRALHCGRPSLRGRVSGTPSCTPGSGVAPCPLHAPPRVSARPQGVCSGRPSSQPRPRGRGHRVSRAVTARPWLRGGPSTPAFPRQPSGLCSGLANAVR